MKFASNECAHDVLRPRVVPSRGRLRDEASRAVTASRGPRSSPNSGTEVRRNSGARPMARPWEAKIDARPAGLLKGIRDP